MSCHEPLRDRPTLRRDLKEAFRQGEGDRQMKLRTVTKGKYNYDVSLKARRTHQDTIIIAGHACAGPFFGTCFMLPQMSCTSVKGDQETHVLLHERNAVLGVDRRGVQWPTPILSGRLVFFRTLLSGWRPRLARSLQVHRLCSAVLDVSLNQWHTKLC